MFLTQTQPRVRRADSRIGFFVPAGFKGRSLNACAGCPAGELVSRIPGAGKAPCLFLTRWLAAVPRPSVLCASDLTKPASLRSSLTFTHGEEGFCSENERRRSREHGGTGSAAPEAVMSRYRRPRSRSAQDSHRVRRFDGQHVGGHIASARVNGRMHIGGASWVLAVWVAFWVFSSHWPSCWGSSGFPARQPLRL